MFEKALLIVDDSEESIRARRYLTERQVPHAALRPTLPRYPWKLPALLVEGVAYQGFDQIKILIP